MRWSCYFPNFTEEDSEAKKELMASGSELSLTPKAMFSAIILSPVTSCPHSLNKDHFLNGLPDPDLYLQLHFAYPCLLDSIYNVLS